MGTITYIGHGSLKIRTEKGTVVYIDPFLDPGWGFDGALYEEPGDLILVTHQHHDHNDIGAPAKKGDCVVYQNFDVLKDGVYGSIRCKDVTAQAVEAYSHHHKKEECVGYLLTIDGKKIYIAGDTAATKDMEKMEGIDICFLPIDGIYTMDAAEASACAERIRPGTAVPYHTFPGHLFSREIAETFTYEGRVILEPGDTLDF